MRRFFPEDVSADTGWEREEQERDLINNLKRYGRIADSGAAVTAAGRQAQHLKSMKSKAKQKAAEKSGRREGTLSQRNEMERNKLRVEKSRQKRGKRALI